MSVCRIAAAAVLLGVVLAPVAARAAGETVTFGCAGTQTPVPTASPQGRECTPNAGQKIDASWKIAFRADSGSGVNDKLKRVELFILSQDPNILSYGQSQPSDQPRPVVVFGNGTDPAGHDWSSYNSAPNDSGVDPLEYTWDTQAVTPYNGAYTIRVKLYKQTTPGSETYVDDFDRKDIKVDNPPVVPEPPVITLTKPNGFNVQWEASGDPDLVDQPYTLLRQRGETGEVVAVLTTSELKTFDQVTEPGNYHYALRVTRRSVVTSGGISSESPLSPKSGIILPPTPVPTPTPSQPPVTPSPTPAKIVVIKPKEVDSPFSALLPFDPGEIPEDGPLEAETPPVTAAEEEEAPQEEERSRGAAPIAVGAFMMSAAFVVRRASALR